MYNWSENREEVTGLAPLGDETRDIPLEYGRTQLDLGGPAWSGGPQIDSSVGMGGRTSECDRDRPPATRIAGRPVVGRGEGDGDGFWLGARLRSVWPRRAGRPRICCQPSAECVVGEGL